MLRDLHDNKVGHYETNARPVKRQGSYSGPLVFSALRIIELHCSLMLLVICFHSFVYFHIILDDSLICGYFVFALSARATPVMAVVVLHLGAMAVGETITAACHQARAALAVASPSSAMSVEPSTLFLMPGSVLNVAVNAQWSAEYIQGLCSCKQGLRKYGEFSRLCKARLYSTWQT